VSHILIIDDDEAICQSFSHIVRRAGHDPSFCRTIAMGLQMASDGDFDVVFLDVRMPDGSGLDLLPRIQALDKAPEVIIMTGYGESQGAELAIRSGAWDYIEKTASIKEITLSLNRALEYRKQKMAVGCPSTVISLKRDHIIGNCGALQACLDQVAKAAACDAPVLINGETGTGKELFARSVHANSVRSAKEFVVVDCAAMPENLIESMLFGHERGAFTGADQTREGLIRMANGGTLFLDEVGELPLGLQKAFLRVLQEHRFRPVGSSKEVTSDFRVVAATNRNLDDMVQDGTFRQDLLFRLKSFVINLPPLKERYDDFKDLVRFHVDRFCERYTLPAKGFGQEFIKTLSSYSWPGNVRELVNILEQTVIASGAEPVIFSRHLPADIRVQATQSHLRNGTLHHVDKEQHDIYQVTELPTLQAFRESLYSDAEKKYLHDLMLSSNNNMTEACRISGLSQSRLYALLKNHNISSH
jgi:two-component system NtrC family response regulator